MTEISLAWQTEESAYLEELYVPHQLAGVMAGSIGRIPVRNVFPV